ncbi:hypothetical protein Tco_1545019, partial [Tanacetum coccineum]
VFDEENVTSEANVILDWGSEQESEYSEEDQVNDENISWESSNEDEEKKYDDDTDDDKNDDEETSDELLHGNDQVNVDEDKEMTNAEDADTRNGDIKTTDATKADAEKAEEVNDEIKKAELLPSGFNLFVSLGFEIPHIQSPSALIVPVSMILEPSVLTPIPETPSVAPATNLLPPPPFVSTISPVLLQTTTPIPTPPITIEAPPVTTIPDPLHAIIQRVYVLEKIVQEIKEVDHTTKLRASLRSEIPSTVNAYLGSSMGDALQKSVQANLINEVKNQLPKFLPKAVFDFATLVIQITVKNEIEKTPLLTILFEKMDKKLSYLTHDEHQALFAALLNSMSLDDAIASGQADP